MDPNAGKKNMFNKLSKEQCVALLEKENFKRVTVSFYKYIILENLINLRDDLYKNWNDLSILGRIYLAEEDLSPQRAALQPSILRYDRVFRPDVSQDIGLPGPCHLYRCSPGDD